MAGPRSAASSSTAVEPRASHVLQAIGPGPERQSYDHTNVAAPDGPLCSSNLIEPFGGYSSLLPPGLHASFTDDLQEGHGSAMSSPRQGNSVSSESGTKKDSSEFETPMTSLSMSPPSRDGSKSTTSWLADPDDEETSKPPIDKRDDTVGSESEAYEQRHATPRPLAAQDSQADEVRRPLDRSNSMLSRNASSSYRKRVYRHSHRSLEQDMQRLSIDSSNTWPSVGSLFGGSSGDTKRSIRQSIAASMSSVARSTYSMHSDGMPAPMLSLVDEELELARQASHSEPADALRSDNHTRHDERLGIFDAIAINDMNQIRRCLNTELVNPNALDEGGRTPLILATAHGHEDVVDLLLSRYRKAIDVNLQDPAGCTPLMYACSEGNLALIRKLLRIGRAQVDIQDKHGDTAMHILASRSGLDPDMVNTLLTIGKPNLDLRNRDGRTALHLAALHGHKPTVQTLLRDRRYNPIVQPMLGLTAAAGSFANRQDNTGKTALHLAAAGGHVSTVQILLADANVNANKQCPRGTTALMDAVTNCQLATVRILVQSGKCEELLRDCHNRTAVQMAAEIAETSTGVGGDVDLILKELWVQPGEVCVEYY